MVDIDSHFIARHLDVAALPQVFEALQILPTKPAPTESDPAFDCPVVKVFVERTPERRVDAVRAGRFWEGLLEGSFDIGVTAVPGAHVRTTLCACRPNDRRRVTPRERVILARVISGELQKTVALDLGLAASTIATDVARALAKLGLRRPYPTIPLPVVVLAQKALGVGPSAVLEVEDAADGDGSILVSTPRPDYGNCPILTRSERAVAQLVAEGLTRKDIARTRETSVHTVANQVSAVLTRLKVTGRFALIRAAQMPAPA